MKDADEKGFALTDALIAAAVAAGVAGAAAQGLAAAARASAEAKSLNTVVTEAELLSARLDAGLQGAALTDGLDGWTVEQSPYAVGGEPLATSGARLALMTMTHTDDPDFSFERIILSKDGS